MSNNDCIASQRLLELVDVYIVDGRIVKWNLPERDEDDVLLKKELSHPEEHKLSVSSMVRLMELIYKGGTVVLQTKADKNSEVCLYVEKDAFKNIEEEITSIGDSDIILNVSLVTV